MSQDRREKIQGMLLTRIEELFTKYDDGKSHEGVLDNAHALERIAQALQAVGHPSQELKVGTVGMYAAPKQDGFVCESTCPCRKIERASNERLPPPLPTPIPGNGRP